MNTLAKLIDSAEFCFLLWAACAVLTGLVLIYG